MKDFKKQRKKFSFRFSNLIVRIIVRKPKYIFLGEKFPSDKSYLFITNHCGKKSPLKLDSYTKNEIRIWGTYEMTMGYKMARKYLIYTYYHKKKHLPKWLAFIVGSIVSPFVNNYYKGMRIIPTYQDMRFVKTLNETFHAIENNMGIVIFPEDSTSGYKKEIPYFYSGFVIELEHAYKKGFDLNVFVGCLIKKKNTFVVLNPIKYSSLLEKYGSNNDDIAEGLRIEMNKLIHFDIKKYKKDLKKKEE